ncbi:MAG: helix-turn-helix domain-containing protein [Planctomycetes bacterium]|nr:helix-turn-helix domain-containing protein [Planctomycetota bacterium]
MTKKPSKSKDGPVEIGVWIPPEILQRKELNDRQKLILSAIVQLYKKKRDCYASNAFFARWLGVPQKEVSVVINALSKKNLIESKMIFKGKQVVKRELTPNMKSLRIKPKRMKGVSRISGEGIP